MTLEKGGRGHALDASHERTSQQPPGDEESHVRGSSGSGWGDHSSSVAPSAAVGSVPSFNEHNPDLDHEPGLKLNPDLERGPLLDRGGRTTIQLQGYQGPSPVDGPLGGNGLGITNQSTINNTDDRQVRRVCAAIGSIIVAVLLGCLLLTAAFRSRGHNAAQEPITDFDITDLLSGHGKPSTKPSDKLSDELDSHDYEDSYAAAVPSNNDAFNPGTTAKPFYRWIYRLPVTRTVEDEKVKSAEADSEETEDIYVILDAMDDDEAGRSDFDLKYCHMAMLTQLPNGHLASLFQASNELGEGNSHQTLYWQTSADGGLTWTPPRRILSDILPPQGGEPLPVWSPVMHTEGPLVHVFFSVSVEQCRFEKGALRWTPGGDIMQMTSSDNGATWGLSTTVYGFAEERGIPKVIANKLGVVSPSHSSGNATWLLPFWRENDPVHSAPACNTCPDLMGVPAVLRSQDMGATWTPSDSVSHDSGLSYNWMVENTVVAATAGSATPRRLDLLQLFRTPQDVPLYASRSNDGGLTWSTAAATQLPNPDSKVHVMALPNGVLLLAYNDSPSLRTPLALAMSRDGGDTWVRVATIEDDPCGQFSYPTIHVLPTLERRVLIAYTVLFLPDKMTDLCKKLHGRRSFTTQHMIPQNGIRMYGVTLDRLDASFEIASAVS